MNAFDYLTDLDRRFSGESNSAIDATNQLIRTLHFRIGRYDLLLPLDASTEVISNITYSPMPISRSWVLGISSLRGELLTLIDLKNYLYNSEPIKKISGRRIVTSKVRTVYVGFIVDHVVGLMNVQQGGFDNDCPKHWDSTLVDNMSGIYKENGVYFGICDLQKMLQDDRHH